MILNDLQQAFHAFCSSSPVKMGSLTYIRFYLRGQRPGFTIIINLTSYTCIATNSYMAQHWIKCMHAQNCNETTNYTQQRLLQETKHGRHFQKVVEFVEFKSDCKYV